MSARPDQDPAPYLIPKKKIGFLGTYNVGLLRMRRPVSGGNPALIAGSTNDFTDIKA